MHEYRIALGLMGLSGFMTGLVDASIDDFSVKAFVWSAILILAMIVVSYEFIVMPTPPRPFLQASLFILTGLGGLLSAHHITWVSMMTLLGKKIPRDLWLAPNIYADFTLYTFLMLILLVIYLMYLIYTNLCSAD
jgi:hypothetical protein